MVCQAKFQPALAPGAAAKHEVRLDSSVAMHEEAALASFPAFDLVNFYPRILYHNEVAW